MIIKFRDVICSITQNKLKRLKIEIHTTSIEDKLTIQQKIKITEQIEEILKNATLEVYDK